MSGGRLRLWVILGALSLAFAHAGVAVAQGPAQEQYATGETSLAGSTRVPDLEARVRDQDAELRDRIEEISTVGADLEEAQARAEGSQARVEDLRRQNRQLERQIAD
ncbi:MAG TPA: hypothetical protein VFI90_17890, partial [Rubrobacter sp.]|nr:hypothetical protein [Rubrobacter sp.]